MTFDTWRSRFCIQNRSTRIRVKKVLWNLFLTHAQNLHGYYFEKQIKLNLSLNYCILILKPQTQIAAPVLQTCIHQFCQNRSFFILIGDSWKVMFLFRLFLNLPRACNCTYFTVGIKARREWYSKKFISYRKKLSKYKKY